MAAQAEVYARARSELGQGRKTSHWMWFVFPQIAGLGHSAIARHFAIADLAEARSYLAHPMLGQRLIACAIVVTSWADRRSARQILGAIDAVKLRSSATLFEAAGAQTTNDTAVFAALLEAQFGGVRDTATLDLLAMPHAD